MLAFTPNFVTVKEMYHNVSFKNYQIICEEDTPCLPPVCETHPLDERGFGDRICSEKWVWDQKWAEGYRENGTFNYMTSELYQKV